MAHTLVQVLKGQGVCEIHLLAPPATLPLADRMPGVSRAIVLSVGHGEIGLGKRRALGHELRKETYSRALVLPNSLKSALVPFFANIPRRTGWQGEARFKLLNDRRVLDKTRYPLMIERFMALALPAGADLPQPYPMPVLSADPENLQRLLKDLDLRLDRGVVVLCPGAEFGPAKRWPAEHYATVARHAIDSGSQVWLLGSPKDQADCADIRTRVPEAVNLAGRTRLVDAVDLMSVATAVICNDSGLMHVACALGRRTIALYGSTSPDFTPPLSEDALVLSEALDCSPCFERTCPLIHMNCLRQLAPERVIEAL